MRNFLATIFLLATVCFASAASRIFFDNFSTNQSQWVDSQGIWERTTNNTLAVTSPINSRGYRYISNQLTNTTVSARVRFTKENGQGVGLTARYSPEGGANYSVWLYASGNMAIEKYDGNTWTIVTNTTVPVPGTNWQTLRLQANSNILTAYLNVTQRLQVMDNMLSSGNVGVALSSSDSPTFGEYDNFSVTDLNIEGPPVSTNLTFTLSWLPPSPFSTVDYYEVWSTTNLTTPFTLWTNVGTATNLVWTIPKSNALNQFFRVEALVYTLAPQSSVTLAWDYNCDPSVYVIGYNIYIGPTSGVYTGMVHVMACTNNRVTLPIDRGNTYFFTATALAASGVESENSNELQYQSPLSTNTFVKFYVPQRLILQ